MRRSLAVLIFIAVVSIAGSWPADTATTSTVLPEDDLLTAATLTFERAVSVPASAIPASVLLRATGIAVFPAASRDGARYYGTGVMSARGARPDYWTPPAFMTLGGTIPLNFELETVDFILIAQTRRGLDYLTQERVVGPPFSPIAPGALGHSTRVKIDTDLTAYVQFDRYFAGVTIDDWALGEIRASNAMVYGRAYSTDEIVRGAGFFHPPASARMWREALADYFREMS